MTTSNFLIGPMKDGIRKDVKPWAIPEDAFFEMTNAYQWRGRVIKRSGYTLLAQLSTDGGTTFNRLPVMGLRQLLIPNPDDLVTTESILVGFDTATSYKWNGTNFTTLSSTMPVTWSGSDSQFFWTINYANAFWATNSKPGLNGYKVTNFTGQTTIGGNYYVNVTSAGNTFADGDIIYFNNVTGASAANNLRQGVVTATGNPFTVEATDGLGAFSNGTATTGIALTSNDTVANQDGVRYYCTYNIAGNTTWVNYNPPLNTVASLAGALLIFAYKGYLVFLNTWEGNDTVVSNYPYRARWSAQGTPFYTTPAPVLPNAVGISFVCMRDDLFEGAGATDGPTDQAIVGAEFIRDILVVYFERSTWRLRYTSNAQFPFVWERVNIELGCSSTFSAIPFDKGLIAIGNRGIVISDANDTKRIDEKIPDDVFNIRQARNGSERVYGIRTFRTKLLYWTIPSVENINGTYPDKVLVFNYDTGNWSYFDDCFTCFGYYYPVATNITWGELPEAWSSYSDIAWNSGVTEQGYENIIAGNQQGYVLLLEQTNGENGPSLAISSIAGMTFTSANNNLPDGSWITLSGVVGTTSDDGVSLNGRNFQLNNPAENTNTFGLSEFKPIDGGLAAGATYTYTVEYEYLFAGSVQINIGSLVFTDPSSTGLLQEASFLGNGTIDYTTGVININFTPSIGSTEVYIRIVSLDPKQGLSVVNTTGAYTAYSGQIAKISGIDIQTKIFNFFNDDKRSRLSRIDFYLTSTSVGQFTCDIFADSSNTAANTPLQDNLLSNVVLTSTSPYQVGVGDQTIFRLYADAIAQTLQFNFYYSDAQMACTNITTSNIEILSMNVSMRRGGRLV